MTYIVNDSCINCKHTDCVIVCPVDCFYEGPNFLTINPDECIDCGVCEPECPADAILPDTIADALEWVDFNQKYSDLWPNITQVRSDDVPKDAEEWHNVEGKIQYFSDKPGKGD